MDFRLLGPLEVADDAGRTLALGAGRQRALLALLLLRANELITRERLVEELWGESPPPTAHKMLHNQVSGIRRSLGVNGRLETSGSAYRFKVDDGELDVHRFERLLERGRSQMPADPEGAAASLRQALEQWRGPALTELAYEPFAQAEIARLEERRLVAFETRVDAELALGRHSDLVPELEAVVAEQPLRERLRGQLMLALYRSGRQAEALEAYTDARRTLVEEVGVEPGAGLRELHAAILAQDPALDVSPPSDEMPAELEGGSPLLAGREGELAWLVERLVAAAEGRGGVVSVTGPAGIGKTRLAAELAREAVRRRMTVLYLNAASAPEEAVAAVRSAERSERPLLLIADDAERLGAAALDGVAALAGGAAKRPLLVLILHRGPVPPTGLSDVAAAGLELAPLGDVAVEQIARLYVPAETRGLPVRALAAESGGVPREVHRRASVWARTTAAGLVEAGADRAAADRGELRSAESDLAGNLLHLHETSERGRLYVREEKRAAPAPTVCPYLGLATFDAAHVDYFFGRERLVAELVARLVGSRLLAVVGPSGSGKSSAVRAGLLPALAAGVVPGSSRRRQEVMRPGAHPLATLKRALAGPSDQQVLLVVDQFEETFTACRDEEERFAFLDALVECALDQQQRVVVVVAMRADFYGRCAAHPELARLVGANQVLVGPMGPDELRRAIELPAERVGLRVEPSLTEALIADVLDEPGGLPLLSAALLELWRERDGTVMRRAAYDRTGGVRGAVGRLAEDTYGRLAEPEQTAARRILLRLAEAGEEEATFVRRRVPRAEFETQRDEDAAAALAALVDSRLVTADADTLEVAHEALLREWPRLRSWLEEDAEGRRLHQHLIHAAHDWEAAGREPGELYRGARLASALDWLPGHEADLNARERGFLDASRAAAERESERQRRVNRRLRGLLAGLAALLALALVAGVVALNQRGEARDAARVADAQRLGVEALGEERLDRALLLSRTAVALDDSPTTRGNLLSVLLRAPAAIGVVHYGWQMYAAAISPDTKVMATGDERGVLSFYDTATRRPLGRPYLIRGGLIQQVSFSPDGGTLAISSMDPKDPEHNAVLDLVDARTHKRRLRLRLPRLDRPAPFVVADAVFLRGGRDLLVRQVSGDTPSGPASPVYRVDGNTGAVTDRLSVGRYPSYFYASATADRERIFLTSQRDDRTWELSTGPLRVVRSWPVGDLAGTVSPDGGTFALGSGDGRVRLLDLGSGRIRTLRGRHDSAVQRMRFTPDRRTLITTDGAGQLFAWDVARGAVAQRFSGHTGGIDGLDVTGDGRTMVTASVDTRAIVWDLAGDRRLDRRFEIGRPFDVNDTPRGIAVSPDGRTLAFTHSDGAVDLVDTRTLRRRASVRALDGPAASIAFSPDGRLLAVTGASGRVTLWNARTLAPAGELRGMRGPSQALAFSPDGKLLAAATAASTEASTPLPLRVWDVRRRALTGFRGRTLANLIAFSPDGELIAAAATERGTNVLDVRTGRLVKRIGIGDLAGQSRSVAFSPDGQLLFIGHYDGTGRLYSTDTWKQVGQPLQAHTGRITFPQFSPDGRTLVTASADGTVVLWDVATQKQIGSPLKLEPDTFASAVLSPDGSRLYAISTRGEGISFDMSPEDWKRHACLVAGRELTPGEWHDALPDRPYQTVCTGG